MLTVYDRRSGRLVDSKSLRVVEELIKLRDTKPFWEVVEKIIEVWSKKEPGNWKSYIVHLDAVKSDQKKTRVGKNKWRGVSILDGHERSMVVDFPVWIYMCIKKLYPEKEEYLRGKEFFRAFARKFKVFAIREKGV